MDRGEAIARLKEHETELNQLGIEHLYTCGSTARGEARPDSDVDLFFDHPEGSVQFDLAVADREGDPPSATRAKVPSQVA
jgi:predicted nucleotidyltransferase